jgi:glycosyltransferase involved in cell wall biosynthesis
MDIRFQQFQEKDESNVKSKNKTSLENSILFIGPVNDLGGIGSVIKLYKNYFKNSTYISTFPADDKDSRLYEFTIGIIKTIKILIFDSRIKIIHIHCASYGSFYRKSIILIIGKMMRKKIIMHMHGGGFQNFYSLNSINKFYTKRILMMADKVLCLSEEWNNFYSNKLKLKNTIVILNAVEKKNNYEHKIIEDKIKILFLGKICAEKGIFDLINFLSTNMYFLNGKIILTICGIDSEEKLKNIIANTSGGSNIKYLGWVDGQEKETLIKENDIYILPSRFEGVPISILEAMAYGKPIIATNVGGIPSLVKENFNGWLIESEKLDQMEKVFDEIFKNPYLLEIYGRNSYAAAKKYNPEIIIRDLEKIYLNLNNN